MTSKRGRASLPMAALAYAENFPFKRDIIYTCALCIECKDCGRRSFLSKENCTHRRPANMRTATSMTVRCSNRCCGSNDVRLYEGDDGNERGVWLAGSQRPSGRKVN